MVADLPHCGVACFNLRDGFSSRISVVWYLRNKDRKQEIKLSSNPKVGDDWARGLYDYESYDTSVDKCVLTFLRMLVVRRKPRILQIVTFPARKVI